MRIRDVERDIGIGQIAHIVHGDNGFVIGFQQIEGNRQVAASDVAINPRRVINGQRILSSSQIDIADNQCLAADGNRIVGASRHEIRPVQIAVRNGVAMGSPQYNLFLPTSGIKLAQVICIQRNLMEITCGDLTRNIQPHPVIRQQGVCPLYTAYSNTAGNVHGDIPLFSHRRRNGLACCLINDCFFDNKRLLSTVQRRCTTVEECSDTII